MNYSNCIVCIYKSVWVKLEYNYKQICIIYDVKYISLKILLLYIIKYVFTDKISDNTVPVDFTVLINSQ